MGTYFKAGTWNVICDVCGKKCKSDEVRKRWDGYVVCQSDFETRHPSDFIRVSGETAFPTYTRPESSDTFVSLNACTSTGRSGIAGYAVSGCATPSTNLL